MCHCRFAVSVASLTGLIGAVFCFMPASKETVLPARDAWILFGAGYNRCIYTDGMECTPEPDTCAYYGEQSCQQGIMYRTPNGAQTDRCDSGAPEEWCEESGSNVCLQYQSCVAYYDPETQEFQACFGGLNPWIDDVTAPASVSGINCGGT